MTQFPLSYWLGFGALVTILLTLDLGVFHRHSRDGSLRNAAVSTLFWFSLAMAFGVYVYFAGGQKDALDFLQGYFLEWALSMDNVFVFAVIFTYFRVPKKYQYRVLFWGIIGAVVLRLLFILVGTALISRFHWVLYILALFLVYTGVKLCFHDDEFDPEASFVIRLSRRFFRVSQADHGEKFFVRENGKRCITPLFLVLLVIDFVDVAFALDSVPAILIITENTFIVFTSNIFAILGLRALYFLLAGAMDMFRYLRFGLAGILVFVGLKLVISPLIEQHLLHGGKIPEWANLLVIVLFLGVAIAASMVASWRENRASRREPGGDAQDGLTSEDAPPGEPEPASNGQLRVETRDRAERL